MASITDGYILERDLQASTRLDAQHLLWKMYNNYTINPDIPISPGMKIADIGSGTGIWLQDLATEVPKTVQLDGYDLSAAQFPHKSLWADNVSFSTLDAFGDVPEDLVGVYDVVHLRFWLLIIRGNNPSALIRHAARLLKPGGYLQWEEACPERDPSWTGAVKAFDDARYSIMKVLNVSHNWIEDIQQHILNGGLDILGARTGSFPPTLVPLMTNTYLGAHIEVFNLIEKLNNPSLPTKAESLKLLPDLAAEVKNGFRFQWFPINLLAQKAR